MANTVLLSVKTEKSVADLQDLLEIDATKDREGAREVVAFLDAMRAGAHRGAITVQTGSGAPTAASGTWTLASVVDSDACSVAGVTLTFLSSPSTESDIEVDIGSAKAFASATDLALATGTITETGHGYLTGDVVRLTTSGSLPTGLALSTDYYVIKVDANSYKLATTYARAVAGTPIFPTALGSGNQTVTPQADKTMAVRLMAAVNAHTVLSTILVASVSGAVVTVTCRTPGVIGNYIAFSDADSTITSSGSGYLAGGLGGAKDDGVTFSLGI